MAFLTDRKRATGLGSARTGTAHFWQMQLTAATLAVLLPLFVFTFGHVLGASHEAVAAYYARPFPAIVAALTIVVGFLHFRMGAQVMIEDYVHGAARRWLILAVAWVSYGAMATGLFALIRLAL
ncbi:MAG: succinate dehydrogenase, hydrophobic membrane anchor protein [Rhodobacteraceae bacterium]|nr:succinate dehydrogenase, hydrophobic membrane anchor protein [Paracoccaceae bacterium]